MNLSNICFIMTIEWEILEIERVEGIILSDLFSEILHSKNLFKT